MQHKSLVYLELTKPRALAMIVFTTGLSYLIAATRTVDTYHLLLTCFGVTLSAGGSLALNQYMERELDSRMARTRSRPIPSGRVDPRAAAIFGWSTMLAGYAFLWLVINPACSIATMVCGISYNFLYTPLKLRSSFSSWVGAIPGGMLPIMGWVAARGKLEIGAWILFSILFLWQIPHALIISIRHQKDYESAGMKQLPIISHHLTSRRQMVLNVLVLVPVSVMPFYMNMTEILYPITALILGFWLYVAVVRYALNVTEGTARFVFISLTAYLPLLLLAMFFDKPS
ncbi:heme o synthase [Sulfidibacter corallicola]|uniref:Protoheme IX farnesyltransferase n=1 Tax=Sulfidibacter corallicola TaxID=2818388 RepID=A0A8A4TSV4_SULCO|nr:heme o synthase [Sulfidibacter corallicola]QTD53036.1 heme o synthase [Sulfidibacter corallicola]